MLAVINLLNTYAKIKVTEAYSNKDLGCVNVPWKPVDVSRIAEVRFRAGEMPEVYYETGPVPAVVRETPRVADEPEPGDQSCELCRADNVAIHRTTETGLLVCGRTACQQLADVIDTLPL